MPDILVTTPKSEVRNAAAEAADARASGGDTEYFRCYPYSHVPRVAPGNRIYYVEDGAIRGYGVISRVENLNGNQCDTTGRWYPAGTYVFLRADSWRWIRPIPCTGFQGFRYVGDCLTGAIEPICGQTVIEVGGWLDPRPTATDNNIPEVNHGT